MTKMDGYYLEQKLIEIWNEIDKLHLNYIDIEEGTEKIEKRSRLEDLIREYLCICAHNQKFCNTATWEVFRKSVIGKSSFSAYKATTGWNALQIYAGNLLMQPWRREFRQIHKYSGFYKHYLEANLKGVELIFEAMGYKSVGQNTLLLDGPIGPDKVISISKDCLIAYVECQIMKFIYEELHSCNVNVTWQDIFEFRQNNSYNPEHCVKALKFHLQQKHFEQHKNSASSQIVPNHSTSNCNLPHYPAILGNTYVPPLPQYLYGSNGTCNNYYPSFAPMPCATMPSILPCNRDIIKPQMNANGYYYFNGYTSHIPTCSYNGYTVPTGQLIELEPQNYDEVERVHTYKNGSSSNTEHRNSERSEGDTGEDWDYVYRSLNDQGYTKDLCPRGDILGTKSKLDKTKHKESRKSRMFDVLDGISNLTVKSNKSDKGKKVSPDVSPASSYDNLSNNSVGKKNKTKKDKAEKATIGKTKNKNEVGKKKWQCKSCTYLNPSGKDICEMCSKTKMNVERPIEIGGSECENCTLVNPKDAKKCQACEFSLKNSPTYI